MGKSAQCVKGYGIKGYGVGETPPALTRLPPKPAPKRG